MQTHSPFQYSQYSLLPQPPQSIYPPHPSSYSPQLMPRVSHVSGQQTWWQRPPTHREISSDSVHSLKQLPQSITPPHPSSWTPQLMPRISHVVGQHACWHEPSTHKVGSSAPVHSLEQEPQLDSQTGSGPHERPVQSGVQHESSWQTCPSSQQTFSQPAYTHSHFPSSLHVFPSAHSPQERPQIGSGPHSLAEQLCSHLQSHSPQPFPFSVQTWNPILPPEQAHSTCLPGSQTLLVGCPQEKTRRIASNGSFFISPHILQKPMILRIKSSTSAQTTSRTS